MIMVYRLSLSALALAAGLLTSVQALGQPYVARDVGDWIVAASSEAPGCFLTRDYGGEGGTTLLFGLDTNGANRLSVLNDNWSIKPKDRVLLDVRLSRRSYPRQVAIGIASNGKSGFVTGFQATFPGEFAASKFLHINRGKIPVARLDLNGSGPGVVELKRCVDALAAKGSALSEPATGQVPKDPFSSDLDAQPHKRKGRAAKRND